MSSQGEPVLAKLLDQPRTVMVLLDMYEGLALSCDDLKKEADQSPHDAAVKSNLDKYKNLYKKRVGIDVALRVDLRREADDKIKAESSAEASKAQPASGQAQ